MKLDGPVCVRPFPSLPFPFLSFLYWYYEH